MSRPLGRIHSAMRRPYRSTSRTARRKCLSDVLDLLGAGLDAAHFAGQNGKGRGQTLIGVIEVALELARENGQMTFDHSLLFAQLWTRDGSPASVALARQVEEIAPATGRRTSNPAEGDALLEWALCQTHPLGRRRTTCSVSITCFRCVWTPASLPYEIGTYRTSARRLLYLTRPVLKD